MPFRLRPEGVQIFLSHVVMRVSQQVLSLGDRQPWLS